MQRSFVEDAIAILCDAVEDIAPTWTPHQTGPNRLQAAWSVLGLPTAAWTISTDTTTRMPIGVQLTGARAADPGLLAFMRQFA